MLICDSLKIFTNSQNIRHTPPEPALQQTPLFHFQTDKRHLTTAVSHILSKSNHFSSVVLAHMHVATVQGAHLEETNLVLFLPVVVIGILMSICSIRAIGSLADSRCWFACARPSAYNRTIVPTRLSVLPTLRINYSSLTSLIHCSDSLGSPYCGIP